MWTRAPVVVVSALAVLLGALVACPARLRTQRERLGSSELAAAADFPDARAVILLDRTEVTFARTEAGIIPLAEVLHTRRIQVLTEAGKDLARVVVSFDERSRVFSIQGRNYKQGRGDFIEMNDAAIVDVPRFAAGTPAASLYGGTGARMARVPNVEVGDVFEVTTLLRVRDPRWLEPVVVGGDLPLLRGEVIVNVQKGLDVDMRVTSQATMIDVKPARIPTTVKLLTERGAGAEGDDAGTRSVFIFDRTPAVFPEGEAADGMALATQVHLLLKSGQGAFRSIDDIASWYREIVGTNEQPDADTKAELKRIGLGKAGKSQKVALIQRYLQDEIKDAPWSANLAALPARTPADVIRFQMGDTKDQAVLGLAMLRAAGLDGLPVLVSRLGSFASIPDLPTPAPFNHVVIAVPAGGSYLWIDPATPGLPTGRLPGLLQGAVGILVTSSQGEFINLPEDEPQKNTIDVRLDLTLAADGSVEGIVRGVLAGVPAARGREILAMPEELQPAAMKSLLLGDGSGDPEAKVGVVFGDAFRVAGTVPRGEGDESMKVQARLQPLKLKSTNVVFDDVVGRPLGFLWREGRRSSVFLGARTVWKIRVDLKMPEGMGIAELPVSVDKPGSVVNVEERWAVADGVLSFQRTFTMNERVIPPGRYNELRAPVVASWIRAQQVVRVQPGGDRGTAYGSDQF